MTSFCGRCGHPHGSDDGPDDGSDGPHQDCARFLVLEPPRFCASCGRRMKVQVAPMGWTATCVEHGTLTAQGSTTAP